MWNYVCCLQEMIHTSQKQRYKVLTLYYVTVRQLLGLRP